MTKAEKKRRKRKVKVKRDFGFGEVEVDHDPVGIIKQMLAYDRKIDPKTLAASRKRVRKGGRHKA